MLATKCRRGLGITLLTLVGCVLGASPAAADDRQIEDLKAALEQMKGRMEKLEQQNEELKRNQQGSPAGKEKLEKAIDSYVKEKQEKKEKQDKEKARQKEEEGYEVGKYLDAKGKWANNLLWFETEDKAFRMHVGGRAQIDAVWVQAPKKVTAPLSQGGIGEFDDAINFRRARLDIEGTFWELIDFYCQYDFVNTVRDIPSGTTPALSSTAGTIADRQNVINTPVPTDFWLQWKKLPYVGNVRVGNQKPLIGFEHLTSSRYLDFLERSSAFDSFVENGNNGFSPGVSVFNNYADDLLFVGGSITRPNFRDIFGWNVGDGEAQYSARVAYNPVYAENGRCMVHVGLGYQHSTADDGVLRFRARTQLRNGPAILHNIVSIIQLQAHDYDLIVPEFAMNYGPFNVSAEYYGAWCTQRPSEVFQNVGNQTANLPSGGRGRLFYQGGYVTLGYFLTGEHHSYNKKSKGWDRQALNEQAFLVDGEDGVCWGRGAWEVMARYSFLNLNDKGVNGGVINTGTLGLNWFLNPNVKIQMNYELGYRDATQFVATGMPGAPATFARDGIYQGFGTRFAFDY